MHTIAASLRKQDDMAQPLGEYGIMQFETWQLLNLLADILIFLGREK